MFEVLRATLDGGVRGNDDEDFRSVATTQMSKLLSLESVFLHVESSRLLTCVLVDYVHLLVSVVT